MEERGIAIKTALLDHLDKIGASTAYLVDLVDKYMEFWDILQQLKDHIRKEGAVYQERNASGNLVMKNNPAIKDLNAVNREMLAILRMLKINPEEIAKLDYDDRL